MAGGAYTTTAICDLAGVAFLPYTTAGVCDLQGAQRLRWPDGLFGLADGSSALVAVGESYQVLDGERRALLNAGQSVDIAGRMLWSGADATTMRAWLLLAAYHEWVAYGTSIAGTAGDYAGAWTSPLSVRQEYGVLSLDFDARVVRL